MAPPIPLKTQVHLRHGDTSVLGNEFKCNDGDTVSEPFQDGLKEGYDISFRQECSRTLSPIVHLKDRFGFKENNEITFEHTNITSGFGNGHIDQYTDSSLYWQGEVMIGGQWKFVKVMDRSTLGKWDKGDKVEVFDVDQGGLDREIWLMHIAWPVRTPWRADYIFSKNSHFVEFSSSDQRLKAILDPVTIAYHSALEAAGLTK